MGNQKGFMGKSLLAFVILCCLTRQWQPALFLHECTRLFKWTVFNENLLEGFVCHSTIVNPTEFGFPINRGRAYTAIVRQDWVLRCGLDQIFRLHISPGLDADAFFSATLDEAVYVCVKWRLDESESDCSSKCLPNYILKCSIDTRRDDY